MSSWRPFVTEINLHVAGRITADDARRQTITAKDISRRLTDRPGVILADEVGMGKTFVSLAVAASVALSDARRRPVIVMVPPGLKEKWSRDFAMFKERCVTPSLATRLRCAAADTGVEFLKLLDDPVERRCQVVLLTHGAMQRALSDKWVRLAVIRQAIHRRHGTDDLRRSLGRCMGQLIWGFGDVDRRNNQVWELLLSSQPSEWPTILRRGGVPLPNDGDPVPKHLVDALERTDTNEAYDALLSIPFRDSDTYHERLQAAREKIAGAIRGLWTECLRSMRLRLPLLILDEAHHLKNARTRLASLFHAGDDDSQSLRPKGSLGGVFERMLFLTATPFQLGHHELCSVIERFDGIDWASNRPPTIPRPNYRVELQDLRAKLDRAQAMALALNETWGRLTAADLVADLMQMSDPDTWWEKAAKGAALTGLGQQVVESVKRTKVDFRSAEAALRPWVIRHLRSKNLESGSDIISRRRSLVGAAISNDDHSATHGLPVDGRALLPFLLAARATLCRPDQRPVFAEGLASSYEAFLHTRDGAFDALDEDDVASSTDDPALDRAEWYLEQLKSHLPFKTYHDSVAHPKIAATAARVVDAWKAGEKVVVFCHFVRTGYALRRAISGRIRDVIAGDAAAMLGKSPEQAFEALEDIGRRFFDSDSKARREIAARVDALLSRHPELTWKADIVHEVVRRFLRTPSFLVRFFPLAETKRVTAEAIAEAFERKDSSGLNLGELLEHFLEFLAVRCSEQERAEILAAVNSMQTGGISDKDSKQTFSEDEIDGVNETLMPNVRLVNGRTKSTTRQRLMLTFNSPFFPEILIASAVMAEGVDLHRYCRYVVHHDLCWNPSTLEQRTGRIDRIGAKVETTKKSIHLYKPFLAATQDERQFHVVSDRERWFNVVMGAEYVDDVASTERQARRVRLATAVAEELTFRLEVDGAGENETQVGNGPTIAELSASSVVLAT
jgi:superfamily II DNA or RNA helicase